VFRHFLRAMFDDAGRGEDRAARASECAQGPEAGHSGKPAVLRRRTITLAVILGLAAIFYGTIAPFEIDGGRSLDWRLAWHAPAAGDTVSNVLIYVPIGVFLRLLVRRRGSSWWSECAWTMSAAVGLSYLTEVVQTMVPARVATWTDVTCNSVGAALGMIWAPTFQRVLRNVHAYLHCKVRREPFAVAAAAALLCVCTYALAPPDFYPSPGHVERAVESLRAGPASWLWSPGPGTGGLAGDPEPGAGSGLTAVQTMDKLIGASAYGFLAFVLVLSAREAGKSPLGSGWYAFSRSAAVAVVIEAAQLFTISHVADVGDLVAAWICCQLGSGGGWLLVSCRASIHERPGAVLRGLVAAAALVLFAWSTGSVILEGSPWVPASISWIPLLNNFDRTWNGLLGEYMEGLLRYALVAGLVVVAFRSHGRRPRGWLVIGVTLASAVLAAAVAAHRQQGLDTAQLALAVLAAAAAVRVDRAVFGTRGAATSPTQATRGDHMAEQPSTGPQGIGE